MASSLRALGIGLMLFAAGCAGAQSSEKIVVGNPHPGYCPVMGDELEMDRVVDNPNLYVDYQGKRYYLCCKDCKPKFYRDPEKWIQSPAAPQK